MICSMSPATQWKKFALKHRHQISYFIFLTIVMPVFNKYYVLFLLLVVQQRWHTRIISKHFLKTRIKKKQTVLFAFLRNTYPVHLLVQIQL